MMDGQRRGFLALLGTAAAGLWIAPGRLLAAPRELVVQIGGSCSFCGRAAAQTKGIAGIPGRTARVCDQCIGLCLQLMQEESGGATPHRTAPPTPKTWAEIEQHLASITEQFGVDEAEVREAIARAIEPRAEWKPTPMQCSFCDKHHDEVANMIEGPTDHICDGCIADAAALLGTCHAHVAR